MNMTPQAYQLHATTKDGSYLVVGWAPIAGPDWDTEVLAPVVVPNGSAGRPQVLREPVHYGPPLGCMCGY